MTRTRSNAAQMAERTEFVVSILKDAKGELVSGIDLRAALDLRPSTFYTFMSRLVKQHPDDISSVRMHKGVEKMGYRWIGKLEDTTETPAAPAKPIVEEPKEEEKAPVKETKTPERYDDHRNDEGYPDPTVYLAMRNTGNLTKVKPGEIWNVTSANGGADLYFLVLAGFNNSVTCVPVYTNPDNIMEYEKSQYKTFFIDHKRAYVNVIRVCTKPFKYFNYVVTTLPAETFNAVKAYVGAHLGMKGVGIVTHEVEVVKEVPVEVVKEVEKEVPVIIDRDGISEKECQRRIDAAVAEALSKVPIAISEEECQRRIDAAVAEALAKAPVTGYTKDECETIIRLAVAEERARLYEKFLDRLFDERKNQ